MPCGYTRAVSRLPRVTAEQTLRALRRDGWTPVRQAGSHVALSHPTKPGTVTVPAHAGVAIGPKLLSSILRQAGISADAFRSLL